jgi:8-oxo-dGTP diphosphatase
MVEEKYDFIVVQKAIIQNEDKFLILKRSKSAKGYPGHWDFAGGKLEHSENHKVALAREVKEETSIDILVEESNFVYVENEKAFAYIILFNCEKNSGEIKISNEHTEFKWVTKDEALKLKLEPYLKAFFETLE